MELSDIARYLLLPLRSASLILMAIFSFGLTLASWSPLTGIPLAFLLLSWFFKYSFVLLDSAAEGVREPPVLSVDMINPVNEQRPLVFLLVSIGLFFVADAASYWFGPVTGTLASLVAAGIMPAIIAIQGATGSVLQSLHPGIIAGLINRLRGDYLVILACVLMFAGLSRMVIVAPFATELPLMLRIALLLYFWLAAYSLIGGVLFTRRLDIGFDAVNSPEQIGVRKHREIEQERDRKIDRIYAEWRGGSKANAWQTVTRMVAESNEPLDELRWLHERASHWPDPGLANRLARELLPKLLAAKDFGEALRVVQSRINADANFRTAGSADLLTLTRLARDAGDRPTARALLKDFERFYPQDKEQRTVEILTRQLER